MKKHSALLLALTVGLSATWSRADEAPSDAPVATPLATDAGWNARWGLLFSLNNIFVSSNLLSSPVVGSIGGVYHLSPSSAIRAGVTLSRAQNPLQVTKVVSTTGTNSVTTYQVSNPGGFTEQYGVGLRADYLLRLMQTSIAPYVGVGGQFGWTWSLQRYVDNVSVVDQRTELDNHNSTFDVTARGLVGAEWRVHPRFALYADYNVTLTLFSRSRLSNRTTLESTVGGVTSTTQTTNERDLNTFFTWATGLAQGASLGLSVLF